MAAKAEPEIIDPSLFLINGHGTSVPNYFNYDGTGIIPTSIMLQPNQYVIMYRHRDELKGSEWIQELIWNKIAQSKTPLEFIKSIQEINHLK